MLTTLTILPLKINLGIRQLVFFILLGLDTRQKGKDNQLLREKLSKLLAEQRFKRFLLCLLIWNFL